jgi:WD40 repeat protein
MMKIMKVSMGWDVAFLAPQRLFSRGHTKGVSALDIDAGGNRLVTGSTDYTVKIFDFHGMKSDCKAFKTIQPSEGHPLLSLSWSPSGDAFLAVTGSAQPKVFTRDGIEECEFPRGDMYIRDLKNTTGHITSCTDGQWHPLEKEYGVTSSADGTVRVWNMWNATQSLVIKPTLRKPGRVSVTGVRYNRDGGLIAGGLEDGTIHIWDIRNKGKGQVKASTGMVAASKFQAYKSRTGIP